MTIAEMLAKAKELRARAAAVVGLASVTTEQVTEANGWVDEAEALESRAALAARAAADNGAGRGVGRQVDPGHLDGATLDGDSDGAETETRRRPVIEFSRSHSRMRCFEDNEVGHESAYRCGMWLRAAVFGDSRAAEYCRSNGIQLRSMTEDVNTSGGYLVPTEYGNVIRVAAEQYGVVRGNANMIPMGRDTMEIPVDNASLTAYPIGELGTFTESEAGAGQLVLSARKWGVITRMSSELAADAVINMADRLAGLIGEAFAYAEDNAGFNGTGASSYHGIRGLRSAIGLLSSPMSSLSAASGTSTDWTKYTLAHFSALTGRIQPQAIIGAKWYCSGQFWSTVMEPLLLAAGGNTQRELGGKRASVFLGYPVVDTAVLPTAAGTAEITCLFGDLARCVGFGDRGQVSIAMSTDGNVGSVNLFETDSVGIRGTERFDIGVYNLGDSSTRGAIVGSLSAA